MKTAVDTSHGRFRLEISGQPGAPAVLLLHGAVGNQRVWVLLLPSLNDYFCIDLDLPAHGRTPAEPMLCENLTT